MTSANKEPEKSATNEPEKNENPKHSEGEVALDPNPSKALTELVTGSENTTSTDESSSKNA
jgi:hypothetical protein